MKSSLFIITLILFWNAPLNYSLRTTIASWRATDDAGNVAICTKNVTANEQEFVLAIQMPCGTSSFVVDAEHQYNGDTYSWGLWGCSSQIKSEYVPVSAVDVRFKAWAVGGETIFDFDFENLDGNKCYRVGGTTLNTWYEEVDCTIWGFMDPVLPVELLYFTGKVVNHKVFLNWHTASELNNSGFYLQRSLDGLSWNNLAFISGPGTIDYEQAYTYTDKHPLTGLNYYRLKQVDYDGAFEYSKIINVKVTGEGSGIRLFPNPAYHSVTLSLESDYNGDATLTIYDFLGKRVKTEILSLNGDSFHSKIRLDDLPAGVYLVEAIAGREQWRKRLIVE